MQKMTARSVQRYYEEGGIKKGSPMKASSMLNKLMKRESSAHAYARRKVHDPRRIERLFAMPDAGKNPFLLVPSSEEKVKSN